MKKASVMWICTTGQHPVGIVKAYDEYEGRWNFYIGVGNGKDLDADVERILLLGQKYHDLDFIKEFAHETPKPHHPRISATAARPVVRGEWEPIKEELYSRLRGREDVITGYKCSACGRRERFEEPFCNCGADMREAHHES